MQLNYPVKRAWQGRKSNRMIALSVAALAGFLLLDFFVGELQDSIIKKREAFLRHLEKQAFYMISVDVRNIEEAGDVRKSQNYEALLRVDNIADEPVYIDLPVAKAFVQTGEISWTEVPVVDKKGEKLEQIYKVEPNGRIFFKKILTISRNIPYNQHTMPKYMYMRFFILLDVLPESGFKKGEVVERRSNTFVFLKPYYVTTEEIRRVIDFGDTKVPAYIPITAFRKWN